MIIAKKTVFIILQFITFLLQRRKNKCTFMPAHTKNIKRHAIALSFAKKKRAYFAILVKLVHINSLAQYLYRT